jgi:hypothetical protein
MVRSPSERSFFTNLGGISHSESIRRTIHLARKNAKIRRTLNSLSGQNSAQLLENDTYQNVVFEINAGNQKAKGGAHIRDSEKNVESSMPGKTELLDTVKLERRLPHENFSERKRQAECEVFLNQVGIAHMVEEKWRRKNSCVKKIELSPSTLFKARPLPGGIWVENDLFASTVSTRGKNKRLQSKEIERNHNVVELNESFKLRKRRDLSTSPSIASGSHHSATIWSRILRSHAASPSEASSACRIHSHLVSPKPCKLFVIDKKQRALQENIKKSNCLVKKASAFSCHGVFSNAHENALSEGEGKIWLEQEVEKLEKQLQRRKKLAREIFNFLGLDPTQYYVASRQDRTDDFLEGSPSEDNTRIRRTNDAYFNRCFSPDANTIGESSQIGSGNNMFARQERWLETKEKRLCENRMVKLMELMKGFTGTPFLSETKGSWERAKAAHDLAVRHQLEEERRRKNEKEVRMQHVECNKEKELEELYAEAEIRKLALKAKVDREQQLAATAKLSRPKELIKVTVQENDERYETLKSNSELDNLDDKGARKVNSKRDRTKRHGKRKLKLSAQLSYADMNDEQFARIMKSIGIDMSSH